MIGETVTYNVNANGTGGSVNASSGPITIMPGQITLTAITPAVQSCIGQCFVTNTTNALTYVTFIGTNFTPDDQPSCTPDPNILLGFSTLVNSGEWTLAMGIDQDHEGSIYHSCKVCKSDGTGCSASVSFGLYSSNLSVQDPKIDETFVLNQLESIAGENMLNGVAQKGYVDISTPNGPAGNFFVGEGMCCIAFDPTSRFLILNGGPLDETGSGTTAPILIGAYTNPVIANAAANGFFCALQRPYLSCASLLGGAFAENTVMHLNVGSSAQSLTMGVTNGTTIAYVLLAGSTPTVESISVTDTQLTSITSQTISGFTAGVPGGSALNAFDQSGILAITSFGDSVTALVSETTLMPIGANISLPGLPVNTVEVGNTLIVSNADIPNAGGTLTSVNLTTGTATAIPSEEVPFLPTAMTPNQAGSGVNVCPYSLDGTRTNCTALSIP